MTHYWRWRRTRYGPLAPELEGRFGEPCEVLTRGRDGKLWVRFADGFQVVALRHAVRRAR
mgnify:FL=1